MLSSLSAEGQIKIGLLGQQAPNQVMFSPSDGVYFVLNERLDTVYRFRSDDALSVSVYGDKLLVKSVYGYADTLISIQIAGSGLKPSFKIRPGTEAKDHGYFDDLYVSASNSRLRIVNRVNLERYVSRVVIGEVGYAANDEYYKIQSIICRTYATRHLERHASDGFDLCDNEHCQVYSGLKLETNEVVHATATTNGLVMVDPADKLILSAFHANCGGQTANSQDVWSEARSYLISVEDTFCLSGRSASWDKTISISELLVQLGFSEPTKLDGVKYDQPKRKKYFSLGTDSIETVQMRRLLQLRSTFFDLEIHDSMAHFTGRGYGHGVGLCQQGAMKMAEHGYSYSQILGYYYRGVGLVPVSSLSEGK